MRMLKAVVVRLAVSLTAVVAAGSTFGTNAVAHAAVHEPGQTELTARSAGSIESEVLAATASVIRPATAAEVEIFEPLALASQQLQAAEARLAPLTVDTSRPRFVGSTVGMLGLYFPIRGAIDGPASQYAIWFDVQTSDVFAEAEFVHGAEGVHVRMVIAGNEVMNELVEGGPPQDGDFWECFRWCLGESLSHEVYMLFRAVCGRLCYPVPTFFCDKCMIALGLLEAGMISGCTYECTKN